MRPWLAQRHRQQTPRWKCLRLCGEHSQLTGLFEQMLGNLRGEEKKKKKTQTFYPCEWLKSVREPGCMSDWEYWWNNHIMHQIVLLILVQYVSGLVLLSLMLHAVTKTCTTERNSEQLCKKCLTVEDFQDTETPPVVIICSPLMPALQGLYRYSKLWWQQATATSWVVIWSWYN